MQTYLNKSETAWLYETKKWFSLYIRWECITSWVSKEKITEKVIWSLDELDRTFVEWGKKWSDKAYEKFYEIIERREEEKEEDWDFDDEDTASTLEEKEFSKEKIEEPKTDVETQRKKLLKNILEITIWWMILIFEMT